MNKNSYTDVDLNRVFPQLNKYCNNKNENTLLSKSSTNHHCKELSKYLFYFKNFTKGKDDIHFKNMFVDVRLSNISYHIKSLMNHMNHYHIYSKYVKNLMIFVRNIKIKNFN